MRFEATIPDNRGNAAVQLADELGLSRSQLIDEALSLFLKAVVEVRRGRRLVTVDPAFHQPACEMATPTLAALGSGSEPRASHSAFAPLARALRHHQGDRQRVCQSTAIPSLDQETAFTRPRKQHAPAVT
jgi:hypothetical protein